MNGFLDMRMNGIEITPVVHRFGNGNADAKRKNGSSRQQSCFHTHGVFSDL
jgi:hypothetical protein